MNTSQRYLPRDQFAERHHLSIEAAPAQVLVVESLTRFDDLLIRGQSRRRFAPARLERDGDRTLADGLVGRFRRPDYALESIQDATRFRAYDRPGLAELRLSFQCEPVDNGYARLLAEPQMYCPDRHSRLLFTALLAVDPPRQQTDPAARRSDDVAALPPPRLFC